MKKRVVRLYSTCCEILKNKGKGPYTYIYIFIPSHMLDNSCCATIISWLEADPAPCRNR